MSFGPNDRLPSSSITVLILINLPCPHENASTRHEYSEQVCYLDERKMLVWSSAETP